MDPPLSPHEPPRIHAGVFLSINDYIASKPSTHSVCSDMNIMIPLASLLISSITPLGFSEPIPVMQDDRIDLISHAPFQMYRGQMVIRVRTNSQTQLDAMLLLTESVWTENIGVGALDIQIKRSNLDAITALHIPHDVLIDDLHARTSSDWNQLVEAERLEQEERAANRLQRGTTAHDDLWFSHYKRPHLIAEYINNIVTLRPDLASTDIIGQSWEGRDMFSITITGIDTPENPQTQRPVVYMFSTVHAREWIAPMTTCYIASKFVEDYDTDPRVRAILDSTRIVIVPIGNPDGYNYSWTVERLWRNTRRDNGDGTFGVNINRNWGYEWGNEGSSGDTSSTNYRGTAPFSEPETANLRDLAISFGDKLIAHMEYHSYSQLVMWPFGYAEGVITPEPDRTYFDQLSQELASEIESVHSSIYTPMQSVDLYPAAGDSPDWFYGELGIPSMLIELRPREADFHPPVATILPNAQENYAAIQHYIERVSQPLTFFNDNPPTTASGTPFELSAIVIEGQAAIDPSSIILYSRAGSSGEFLPTALALSGLTHFTAILPPLACGDVLEYYFTGSDTDGSAYTFPTDGASSPFNIQAEDLVEWVSDDLETDTGWIVGTDLDTATSGIWTRMDPEGTRQQPENDHTPDGTICWVTDGIAGANADDRDVDNGFTTLTSPIFDATTPNEPTLSFWYLTSGTLSSFDHLVMSISNNNGDTWIEQSVLPGPTREWTLWSDQISNIIKPTNQMRIKFVIHDRMNDSTVEAAIDDFRVEYTGCLPSNPADLNNDGLLNFFDISLFITAYNSNKLVADFNQDGLLNFFDISAFLVAYTGG